MQGGRSEAVGLVYLRGVCRRRRNPTAERPQCWVFGRWYQVVFSPYGFFKNNSRSA